MNISVKGEYALHAIFDLSLQKGGEPIKIADIARRQKIPQKFLELILSGLSKVDLWNPPWGRRRLSAVALARFHHGGTSDALRGRFQKQPTHAQNECGRSFRRDLETSGSSRFRRH